MPLAGAFLPDLEAARWEQKYPITMWVCDDCGLVQIAEQIDPDILFRKYNFSTRTVPSLVAHFQQYAKFIAKELGAKKVMEFGCNDGMLLAALRDLGVSAVGIDAAENILNIAREENLDVIQGYFNAQSAGTALSRFGPANVVTGSNCFAHNSDPGEILNAAKMVLAEDGLLILEVMYAGDLLDKLQWDTLYHEHLAVYSLGAMEYLLERHGFSVVDVFHMEMHAGALRILARPRLGEKASDRVLAMRAQEARTQLGRAATWLEFGRRAQRAISVTRDVLADLSQRKTIWAYGASGRAAMWFNACQLDFVTKVLDSSPLRAGKFMPGCHQPIELPCALEQGQPDYIFITAWNYADSIRAKETRFQGNWITPLPRLAIF